MSIQEGTKYVLDQYGPSAAGRVQYITWQLPAPEVNDCCSLRASCQVESSRRLFLPKLAAGELLRVENVVQTEQQGHIKSFLISVSGVLASLLLSVKVSFCYMFCFSIFVRTYS